MRSLRKDTLGEDVATGGTMRYYSEDLQRLQQEEILKRKGQKQALTCRFSR